MNAGVPEDFNVRSSDHEDSSLLVISKSAFDGLIVSYPEQSDIIMTNLLLQFGLTRDGEESARGVRLGQQGDEEGYARMRESIRRELRRSQDNAMGELTYAASMGQIDAVRHLLARGLPINQGDYDDRTTLHVAVAEGQAAIVKLLLAKGASVDVVDHWGATPLLEAFKHTNLAIAEVLVQHGAKMPRNCFAAVKQAAESDDAKLSLMVAAGADANSCNYDQRSVLHMCCASGDLRAVESLLANGADVNIRDRCGALCGGYACSWQIVLLTDRVQFESDGCPTVPEHCCCRWGGTPIEDAIQADENDAVMVNLLKRHGARLSRAFQHTALFKAAREGNVRMLALLADSGAALGTRNYDGVCSHLLPSYILLSFDAFCSPTLTRESCLTPMVPEC